MHAMLNEIKIAWLKIGIFLIEKSYFPVILVCNSGTTLRNKNSRIWGSVNPQVVEDASNNELKATAWTTCGFNIMALCATLTMLQSIKLNFKTTIRSYVFRKGETEDGNY